MAEHRWSILCRRACIDKLSNALSLHEVTHSLKLSHQEGNDPERATPIPLDIHLVSLWERSDPSVAEFSWTKVGVAGPSGEFFPLVGLKCDLQEENLRTRLVYAITTIPFCGPGTYEFRIEAGAEQDGDMEAVAEVPLELMVEQVPAP